MRGGEEGEGLLLVGKVRKPHGVRGAVYIRSETDFPEQFARGETLFIEFRDGTRKEFTIEKAKDTGRDLIVKFEEVNSREEAESLAGCEILAPPFQVDLAPDEFLVHELVGLEVFSIEGERIGVVRDILFGPAHELIEIERGEKRFLVPFVREFIKEIDIERKRILIKLIEGLLP